MKSFEELYKLHCSEAEISGDAGGSATNIASGQNSGNVVGANPEDLGLVKRKKSTSADVSYAKSGLPKELPAR